MALEEISPQIAYVIPLDNDVDLANDALAIMVDYMERNPYVGVVGPRIVHASQPVQLNAGAIWINQWGGANRMEDSLAPTECDTLLGAVILVRRQALTRIGRWFDPSLYSFVEVDECCCQLRKAGFRTRYVPMAFAHHDTAQSTGKHSALSKYLSYRNGAVSVIRNTLTFPRTLWHCIWQRSWIPLYRFVDGLRQMPLTDEWWQSQLTGATFRRP
jgi:hypothetical protein